MDWAIFHALNDLLQGHGLLGDEVADFSMWSPLLMGIAVVGLWLVARPGTVSRWKGACASGLASAAVALTVNQVIAQIWFRPRPTDAHPGDAHLLFVSPSADPSFPSDHAAAAFALAFAVFFVSRCAGSLLLVAAGAIGLSRVIVGLHYPSDVLAGLAVGLVCAWAVHAFAQRPLRWMVALVSRATDPLVRPIWRLVDARAARRTATA